MTFILGNPNFIGKPVKIESEKAVKALTAYINKPIALDDEVLIVLNKVTYRLKYIKNDGDRYYFEIVPLRNHDK